MADDPRATIEQLARRIAGADYVRWQEQLADVWRLTQLLVIDNVERLVRETPGSPPEQLFAVMTETGRRLRDAEAATQSWINLRTPAAFRAGLKQAEQQLAAQGVTRGLDFSWTLPNRRAVEQIASETMGDLLEASRHVEGAVRQRVQQALRDEARRAVAAGMNQHAVAQRVAESLTEQGVFAVQDRLGRDIPIGRYAEIVGNVKLREAHTRGTIAGVQEHGGDLVRISTHIHRPDSCSPYEGKVYSLTGRTEGWPRLERQTPFHPGCKHVTMPFVTTFRSDAELDKIRAESNKPGQITVYGKTEMKQLTDLQDKRQRFMRAKRGLRKADELAIARGERQAPKDGKELAAYERSLSARATAALKRARAMRDEPLAGSRVLSSRMAKHGARVVVEPRHVDAVWESMQGHLKAGVLPEGMERSDVELVAKYLSKARAPLTWDTIRKGGDLGASALLHEITELKWYSDRGHNPFNPKVQAKHYPDAHTAGLISEHDFLFALVRERGSNLNQKGSLVRWNPNAFTDEQQVRDVQWMQRLKPGLRFDQADEREAIRFYARLQREQNALPTD